MTKENFSPSKSKYADSSIPWKHIKQVFSQDDLEYMCMVHCVETYLTEIKLAHCMLFLFHRQRRTEGSDGDRQAVATDSQAVATDSQAVATDSQAVATDSQAAR